MTRQQALWPGHKTLWPGTWSTWLTRPQLCQMESSSSEGMWATMGEQRPQQAWVQVTAVRMAATGLATVIAGKTE